MGDSIFIDDISVLIYAGLVGQSYQRYLQAWYTEGVIREGWGAPTFLEFLLQFGRDCCCALARCCLMVTFLESTAQVRYACFVINGCGMVLSSITDCCMDQFLVCLIAQYIIELINGSEFGAYRRWCQQMIHQYFVPAEMVFLKNVLVDDGCGV